MIVVTAPTGNIGHLVLENIMGSEEPIRVIAVSDKKLKWIEGTTARWDGYLEFQRRPRPFWGGLSGTCPEPNCGFQIQ